MSMTEAAPSPTWRWRDIWAMARAPIAMVAALRETSVIFGMLLAVILLHEKFTIWRGIAVILVACGAMLLKLA